MDTVDHQPDKAGPGYLLKHLHLLFFRPRHFVQHLALFNTRLILCLAAWSLGASNAVERIDRLILQRKLGAADSSSLALLGMIEQGWLAFLLFITVFGALGGFFTWLIGGWFYNLRLSLCGAKHINKQKGRLIYLLSNLVLTLPHLILLMVAAIHYPDYLAYQAADEYWSLVLLVFPFWSVVVSFCSVRAAFDLIHWKAVFWFFALPVLFYLFTYGAAIWFVLLSA